MRHARKNEPFYKVKEVPQREILDFQQLSKDQNWKSVKIMKLKEIQVTPNDVNVQVKYEYNEEPRSVLIAKK